MDLTASKYAQATGNGKVANTNPHENPQRTNDPTLPHRFSGPSTPDRTRRFGERIKGSRRAPPRAARAGDELEVTGLNPKPQDENGGTLPVSPCGWDSPPAQKKSGGVPVRYFQYGTVPHENCPYIRRVLKMVPDNSWLPLFPFKTNPTWPYQCVHLGGLKGSQRKPAEWISKPSLLVDFKGKLFHKKEKQEKGHHLPWI